MVPHAAVSSVVYLNRCVGGCTITGAGNDDARTGSSRIASSGSHTVTEFTANGMTGADADAEWNALVQCVREVYSPFDVQVVDQLPTAASYHMAVVAGLPSQIDQPDLVLGVALSGCNPQDNLISFSFANAHGGSGDARVQQLCWTVAQESAHSFGMPNHSWAFADGTSACNDPMTYRDDCGGQKFFRNANAVCGEGSAKPCACGSSQNSHLSLLNVFGAGTPIYGAPTSTVTLPQANAQLGAVVAVQAGSKRGVSKVELLVNGYKWAETTGVKFGLNGQPNPAPYTITVPTNLPGGVVDIVARACDDLGSCTDSATVTATKGAPCASAESCAAGQMCEAGKCFWEPAAGEIGDACTFDQACLSGKCSPTVDDRVCTQPCAVGVATSCPESLECLSTEAGAFCYPRNDGGGCSAAASSNAIYAQGGLSALVFGFLAFRRRRR